MAVVAATETRESVARAALSAVFAAAAAFVAVAAKAQESSVRDGFSFRAHDYDEAAYSGQHDGSTRRYRVRTEQASLNLTVRGGYQLAVDGSIESMSGSSPWFVIPDEQGRPFQVLSGASIADSRRELAVGLGSPQGEPTRHRVSAQHSVEDDYRGSALGYQIEHALSAQRTLAGGFSVGDDALDPTDARQYGRIEHADKRSRGGFIALTTVLDRNRQVQVGLNFERHAGYLSDPYKQVLVGERLLRDTRPDRRQQWAAVVRYRHALRDGDAALHTDYRFSRDDWGLRGHELQLVWWQELGRRFEFGPSLRYYSQSAARFYAPFLDRVRADGHASSDYRLGRFGAFALGVNLRWQWQTRWAWVLSAERYRSDTGLALGGRGAAVPALVDFDRVMLGVDWNF